MQFLIVILIIATLFLFHCHAYQLQQPPTVTSVKLLNREEYNQLRAEQLLRASNWETKTEEILKNSVCGTDKLMELFSQKHKHGQEVLNVFQQGNSCPMQSEGDNPTGRDQYSSTATMRSIDIEFAVERGTTFASNAAQVISLLVTDMNTLYNPLGFQFVASVVEWGPLLDTNGDTIDNWFVSLPCETSRSYSQPCREHVGLVNKIFEQRGGFRKNNTLVVLVANTQSRIGSNLRVNGFAYFPWMPNNGLMVVIPEVVAPGITTVHHEMGHSLGLWHIHRGSYEILTTNTCPNPLPACYEAEANDVTGDFCSDTGPFPNANVATNLQTCRVPTVQEAPDFCNPNRQSWSADGVTNMMGYMPNNCRNQFSMLQGRRMRCYHDKFGYPNRESTVEATGTSSTTLWSATLLVVSLLMVLI